MAGDVILGNIDGDFLVDNSHLDNFFVCFVWKKTLVFKVKNNSFIDFLSKLSYSATILSFFKVHTISLFWKKLTCSGLPYFQINWVLLYHHWSDFYLHNKHIIIKLKSLKISHYPVFLYMHTITCSFQAEKLKKFAFFNIFEGGRTGFELIAGKF